MIYETICATSADRPFAFHGSRADAGAAGRSTVTDRRLLLPEGRGLVCCIEPSTGEGVHDWGFRDRLSAQDSYVGSGFSESRFRRRAGFGHNGIKRSSFSAGTLAGQGEVRRGIEIDRKVPP